MANYQVRFYPKNISIQCASDQTIAEAALAQAVVLPVSCENGVCCICQGKLIAGKVGYAKEPPSTILVQDNQVLCCLAQPKSDIEIQMSDVYTPDQKPSTTLACQVKQVTYLQADIYQVLLYAPAGKVLDFLPGQYCLLHVGEGEQAEQLPYSIANAVGTLTGKDPRIIELHIAVNSDKAQAVIDYLKSALTVTVTLPFGSCIIDKKLLSLTQKKPLVFVAFGSGFSQIKALIEGVSALAPEKELHFYWSSRNIEGFYLNELPQAWVSENEHFHYHPIIHEQADDWNGRAGWVYEAIHEDFDDLTGVPLFVCGSPNSVFSTMEQLEPLGLTRENTYSDVFEYAG